MPVNETTTYGNSDFETRQEYLDELAENCGNPALVYALADMLGKSEDFDGLITSIEDAEMLMGDDWNMFMDD